MVDFDEVQREFPKQNGQSMFDGGVLSVGRRGTQIVTTCR